MKKWLAGIFILLVLFAIIFSFTIPSTIHIGSGLAARVPVDGMYRSLSSQELWDRYNPSFRITKRLKNSINLNVQHGDKSVPIHIFLYPITNDSTALQWTGVMPDSGGFFRRIPRYLAARAARNKVSAMLDSLRSYCEKETNLYSYPIQQGQTKDTFLLSTRFTTAAPPSMPEVYGKINYLRSVATSLQAYQAGFPMLNVTKADTTAYQTMVALPINRYISETNKSDVSFVRMVPGRFMVMDITGGPETIRHGHTMMQLYFQDHKRTSMAIPFESLLTDRIAITDTAKWVTRIWWPVY